MNSDQFKIVTGLLESVVDHALTYSLWRMNLWVRVSFGFAAVAVLYWIKS